MMWMPIDPPGPCRKVVTNFELGICTLETWKHTTTPRLVDPRSNPGWWWSLLSQRLFVRPYVPKLQNHATITAGRGLWAGRVDHWWLLSCIFLISSLDMAGHLRLQWHDHGTELMDLTRDLCGQSELTDVTLTCAGGVTFNAHRLVLAGASSYFRSTFQVNIH